MSYACGYSRYLKTSEVSVQVNYNSHPLHFFMRVQDKKGLSHHLVNEGRFEWVRSDEK